MTLFKFNPIEIGKRLKSFRKNSDLKQSQVAKAGNVSVNSYSSWEQGKFTDIKVGHLFPVAQMLGTTIEELVTGEDHREQFEEEKMKAAMVMVFNLYKEFISQMTANELYEKVIAAYRAEDEAAFVSSLETAFKR